MSSFGERLPVVKYSNELIPREENKFDLKMSYKMVEGVEIFDSLAYILRFAEQRNRIIGGGIFKGGIVGLTSGKLKKSAGAIFLGHRVSHIGYQLDKPIGKLDKDGNFSFRSPKADLITILVIPDSLPPMLFSIVP